MRPRPGLRPVQQPGEGEAEETEEREDPHPQGVAARVVCTRAGEIVGPADQEVEAGQPDVLDHRHETVCRAEPTLLNDVGDGRPHHRRD